MIYLNTVDDGGTYFTNYDKIVEELTKTRSIIEYVDTDEMTQSLLCTNYNKLKDMIKV